MFYKSMKISDMCHSIITSDKEFVFVCMASLKSLNEL